MKQKQTVKKRLAILMSAVLLASSLPLTSLAVVNLGGGKKDDWQAKVTMTAPEMANVGEPVTVKITGEAYEKDENGKFQLTPSNATASDAVKKIDENDIEVTMPDGKPATQEQVTVSSITWVENKMTGTFTVTSTVAGTVTLKLEGTEATCEITFTEKETASVTSLEKANYTGEEEVIEVVINGGPVKVYVKPVVTGGTVDETFYKGLEKPETECPENIINVFVGDITKFEDEWCWPVQLTAEKAAGMTTLTVNYPGCNALVYQIEVKSVAYEETKVTVDPSSIKDDVNDLAANSDLTEEEVEMQIGQITNALETAVKVSDITDDIKAKVTETYKDEIEAGKKVVVKPEVVIEDIDLSAGGKQVVVDKITMELSVGVYVEDEKKADLSDILNGETYIKVEVPVPGLEARGGKTIAIWNHYEDGNAFDAAKPSNEVLKATKTTISDTAEGSYAYVESKSFSPFTLEFGTPESEPPKQDDDDDNTGGSSSSGSSSSDNGSSDSSSSSGTSKPASTEKPASAPTPLAGDWEQDETGWWFSETDGTYPASEWAWIEYEGQCYWYHFNAAGYMDTDWFCDLDGKWYYLNPISDGWKGRMLTGWAYLSWEDQDSWYYFNADGSMATGWVKDGELQYYLHPVSDGTRGHMYTGWQQIEGTWYYFSEVSDGTKGHLLTGTTTPDGNTVDASGAWVQ